MTTVPRVPADAHRQERIDYPTAGVGKPLAERDICPRRAYGSDSAFGDLPLADRDREWNGDAAETRVRAWAGAEDGPNEKYRDAHVWYDADTKENFGAYKLLIADVIDDQLTAVPRGIMAAGAVMQGSRGGIDLPTNDIDRVKSHLAKYYAKMDDSPPWDRD